MACMGDALRTAKIQIYVCEVVVRAGEGEVRKEDKIETERINGDDRPLMRLTNTHIHPHTYTHINTHTPHTRCHTISLTHL
jgi:hypothetical protein